MNTSEIHELKLPAEVPSQHNLIRACMRVYSVAGAIVNVFRHVSAPPVGCIRFVIEEDDYRDLTAKIYDRNDRVVTQFEVVFASGEGWYLQNYKSELDAVSRLCGYLDLAPITNSEFKDFIDTASSLFDTNKKFQRDHIGK